MVPQSLIPKLIPIQPTRPGIFQLRFLPSTFSINRKTTLWPGSDGALQPFHLWLWDLWILGSLFSWRKHNLCQTQWCKEQNPQSSSNEKLDFYGIDVIYFQILHKCYLSKTAWKPCCRNEDSFSDWSSPLQIVLT